MTVKKKIPKILWFKTVDCDFPWFCKLIGFSYLVVIMGSSSSDNKLKAGPGVIVFTRLDRELRWLIHIVVSDVVS